MTTVSQNECRHIVTYVTCCQSPPRISVTHVTCYQSPPRISVTHVTCCQSPPRISVTHVTCCQSPPRISVTTLILGGDWQHVTYVTLILGGDNLFFCVLEYHIIHLKILIQTLWNITIRLSSHMSKVSPKCQLLKTQVKEVFFLCVEKYVSNLQV
jgi:hypothetical protein